MSWLRLNSVETLTLSGCWIDKVSCCPPMSKSRFLGNYYGFIIFKLTILAVSNTLHMMVLSLEIYQFRITLYKHRILSLMKMIFNRELLMNHLLWFILHYLLGLLSTTKAEVKVAIHNNTVLPRSLLILWNVLLWFNHWIDPLMLISLWTNS